MEYPGEIFSFFGEQKTVGLSGIVGVTVIPGQIATTIKHGGGGTLWAGGATVGLNSGYLMTTGETINADSCGTLYFMSTGAPSTIYILRGKSSGYEP